MSLKANSLFIEFLNNMKNHKLILAIFLIIFLNSCTEQNVVNTIGYKRTLVIMSDNDEATDLVVSMSGLVRSQFPDVAVVYIPARPFDIEESAYLLQVAAENYPPDTYFVTVVEPGAMTKKMVFQNSRGQYFLAPDNGLASRVIKLFGIDEFHYVENKDFFGGVPPMELDFNTYYNKALIAMLRGEKLESFGEKITQPVTFPIIEPSVENGIIKGEILFSDLFGNCVTNISKMHVKDLNVGEFIKIRHKGGSFLATFGYNYGSVPVGQNLAFINGSGRLELAVNYGNIKSRYALKAATAVEIIKPTIRIGILQYNESSVVSDIASGMKAQMAVAGLTEGNNFQCITKSANGDKSKFQQLISELVNSGIDLLVPISTPAAQAAVQWLPDSIPVVYTYVTDPESAGITNKRQNVCGLSDATNFSDYLNFVKELLPDLKKPAFFYNSSESNSVFAQQQISNLSVFYGIEPVRWAIADINEIHDAFFLIKQQGCTAALVVADNTMSLGMSVLSDLAIESKMPVIGDSFQHSKDGALASISVDYTALALGTGNLAVSVLRGVNPNDIPIQRFSTNVIALNTATASKIGFTFSAELLSRAKYIFQ